MMDIQKIDIDLAVFYLKPKVAGVQIALILVIGIQKERQFN
jgi:hypothetical protein